jgi:phosphate/sulfate permease
MKVDSSGGSTLTWNIFTWRLGLPSSSSHALIGGLMGAAVMTNGWAGLQHRNILGKIILPLVGSPVAGFVGAYVLMLLLARVTSHWSYQAADNIFRKLQIAASGLMSLSHGLNDAQKTIWLISLALIAFGRIPATAGVPQWVKVACALCMGLGTVTGGWKIIRPIDLATAWVLTIPASALVGACCQYLLQRCGIDCIRHQLAVQGRRCPHAHGLHHRAQVRG